jgi:hypothetical protein
LLALAERMSWARWKSVILRGYAGIADPPVTRLVPGFVVDCRLDGDGARVVTFFNGAAARQVP